MRDKRQEARGKRQKANRTLCAHVPPSPFPLPPSSLPPRPFRGMTLIELLVVIVILTTVVAAAIPIVSPTNDGRRLREATRGLNTYIFGAQTRAIALNRPYGIAIKRLSQDTNPDLVNKPEHEDNAVAVEVFYVEQQPPYSGFDRTSAVQIAIDNGSSGGAGQVLVRFVRRGAVTNTSQDALPDGWDPDEIPAATLRPGDIVEVRGSQFVLIDNSELDPQGYYRATSGTPDGTLVTRPLNDTGQVFRPVADNAGAALANLPAGYNPVAPFWSEPSAYKVLRQPMPTSDPPYQLPEGTAIDLRASGVGINDYFYVSGLHDNPQGILIMFAPEGRISRVSFGQMPYSAANFDEPVVDNVYLLVGRRENAPPPEINSDPTLSASVMSSKTDEEMQDLKKTVNWLMGESRWIAIGAQSGRIVTVENAFVDPRSIAGQFSILGVSEQLRNEQIQKARQFTREMSQLGGR